MAFPSADDTTALVIIQLVANDLGPIYTNEVVRYCS